MLKRASSVASLLTLLLAQPVLAAAPGSRVSLSAGFAARSARADDGVLPAAYAGLSFFQLRAAGAYFPLSFLGAAADLSGDWFAATGTGLAGERVVLPVSAYRVRGAVAGRLTPTGWLGLELQLGYWYVTTPALVASTGVIQAAAVSSHAPVGSLVVTLGGAWPVSGQLFAHLAPVAVGANGPPGRVRCLNWAAGAQLAVGALVVGPVRGALVVDYELSQTTASSPSGWTFAQTSHRVGLGLRLDAAPPPPPPPPPPSGPGALRGRVVTAAAQQPLADVPVTVTGPAPALGGADGGVAAPAVVAVRTDADGGFTALGVGPGAVGVRVEAPGYRRAEREVAVPPGGEAQVSIAVELPTGPGTIRGVVTVGEAKAPAAGLEVSVAGAAPVKTGEDGAFALPGAGPGPVELAVKGEGYEPLTEAVRVPPEGEVSVSLAVRKRGVKKPPGTLRGLIRSVSGKPVRATVTVTETRYKAKVGGDGRFSVSVPGGRYTLVIEAPGFVTQTLAVELADGDHAIFHCDLEPVRK